MYWIFLSSLLSFVTAQSPGLRWQFTNQSITNIGILDPCDTVQLSITGEGTPPYFLRAFIVGKSARLYPLDESLEWTADLASGTQFLLSMVDSSADGGSGATSSLLSISSKQASCTPANTEEETAFTLSGNVTAGASLDTCATWGVLTSGGTPPFTFSLMAPGSPIMTNITGGPDGNLLEYVNRASPNGQLIAAVSDSTGKYASGTALVKTSGGTDFECGGRASVVTAVSSGARESTTLSSSTPSASVASTSPLPPADPTPSAATSTSSASHKTLAIAVGVSVPVVVLIIGSILSFFIWRHLRRRSFIKNTQSTPFPPTPVSEPGPTSLGVPTLTRSGTVSTRPSEKVNTYTTSTVGPGTEERSSPAEVVRVVEVHHHHHHGPSSEMPPPYEGR